ncbi:hypothetical protein D1F64_06600 [Breoghania sp. L-A4]|nr:hypothetical protein D1F64_06600 [Breoghania sp. L-A4]
MTLRTKLLHIADAFADTRRLSRSRVSTLSLDQGSKLDQIANGADISTGRYERAMSWFSNNWPDGAEWPEEVSRPLVEAQPQFSAQEGLA